MTNDPFTRFDAALSAPGILSGFASRRGAASQTGAQPSPRFVTQSHALGATAANPRALVVAAVIALALVMIARRLSE